MATTEDFLKSLDSSYNKPRSTEDFLKSLGRNQADTYRNSQQGVAELDGVAGMDKTSAAFVRGLQKNFGSGGGDVGRAIVQAPSTLLGGALGGAQSFGGGAYQALGDGLEAVGLEDNWAQKQAAYNHAQVQEKQQAAAQNYQTSVGRDVGSGLYSTGATAPLTLASIASRNPAYMTGGAGVQTAADTYVADRQDGATVIPSLLNAIGQGSAEVLGEALPSQALVGMAARGINTGRLGSYALGELGGEAATGLVQDATGTAVHNNNQQGWQGFNERIPDTIQSSVVGGAVQGGVNLAMVPVANAARDVVKSFQQPAQQQPPTLNQANQAVGTANSTSAFMAKLDANTPVQPQAPQPQAPVQPQQQAPVTPKAQSNLLASIQELAKPNATVFKTRTDVPTVQQLTGQQPKQQAPVKPPQEVSGNQAVQNTVNKIIGVESGGKANNPNPSSSANGLGQFIDSTWLAMVKKYRPDVANGKSRGQILALKTNPSLGREMTVRYVQENAGILRKAGLPVTEGNLYLAHFSGPETAARVLKGNPNAPASSVYGADAINANKSILQGKTLGQVAAWANRKMGGKAAANYQGDQAYVDGGDMAAPVESPLADTSMFDDNIGNESMLDAAQAQREAAEEMQDVARKLGKQTTVRIGDEKADADMMLIDALDLSPSVAGTENQYRDRNRAASQIQVNKIANELDPEILGDSKLIDTGAPTLAADGKTIIGGNGRTMGILQAYEQGNGQQYKDYIANHAADFGINAADVLGMERPVLVRRLRDGGIDVGKASIASNENSGLAMSALEQARVDSGRLPNFGSLQFADDGNLNIPANRGFIRDFVGQMPTTMQAQMVDAGGNLSQDGYRRMQNAILHRAYGNTPALSRMVEATDQGTRNLLTAMMKSAPKIAAAKDAIQAGNMHDADIGNDLVGAVETINQLRTEGRSVADYLAQQGMFTEDLSPVARELVAFLDENIRSAKKISELIEAYYDVLAEQGSPNQDDIFGENIAPTKEKIYDAAKQQFQREHSEPEQSEIFEQPTERSAEPGTDGRTGEPGQESEQQPSSAERDAESVGKSESEVNEPALFRRNAEPNQDIQSKIADIEAAIQEAVGDLSHHIEVVSAYEMFPADVAKSYIDGNAEGAYFPKDRKIYILAESMTPERARWVAWHELGHRGFDTPQFKNYQALVTQARNNPVVDALSKAIMKDRKQYADDRAGTDINVATEEAIVELLAASKTGNYAEIEQRYGIKPIQPEFKTTLQRLLDKFKALMAKVTGHAASDFTNEDVMDLLRSIEMAAAEDVQGGRDGEAKLSRAKENIADFVDRVIDDKTLREQLDILDVTDKEVDVAQSNGLDISSYSHMIDSSAVNHILKNHGNAQTEQKRGQIAITKTDFEFMPDVIANPDKTIFGTKNNVGREQIVYLKKMQDGSLLMIEEQRTGRKRLALHTMRKYPATTDDSSIERTLLSNAQGDSGNELSIVNHLEDDNKNKDVLFSRKQKLSWNYLTSRNQMKEFQAGVDAFNWITQSLQPWLDKVGMANNTPSLARQYMRDYKASLNVASQKAKIFAEQAKQLTQAEREFLSDVIENELPEGVIVPPEIQQLAIAIRAMMNKQTDDLLALQMISPESAERFRDTYLPRIYSKAIKQRDGMFSIRKEWQKAKQGIDGKHLRGRGIFELVNASEQALWESRGYEKRYDAAADSNGSARVIMWRDYSKQERVEMGENRDAALRVLTGYLSTQKDIGLGTLYLRIASNPQLASKTEVPGWILVSNDSIAGSVHIKKYGAMAGMYVDPATLSAIDTSILLQSKFPRVWLWALTTWKVTKTVFNPVAHFNNVASNFQMYLMAGGKMRDLWKASQSLRKKDQFYQEALEQGLVGDFVDNAGLYDMFGGIGGMKEAEAAGNFIERLMQRADKLSTMKLVLGSMGAGAAYGAAMGGVAGAAVGGALGASTGGLYKMKEKAKALYSMEDEVFRMALYKLARDRGLSESDAVGYAQQYMFDYSDIPPAVRFARDSGAIPFVTYTYKAVPAMLRLMLTRPHRVALNMALLWGINKASYFFLGLDGDDEDEERKYMPDYQKGMTAMSIPFTDMGIPKLLRMPFNDENGDPVYLDIMRMTPLGDFWDWTNQNGGIPMPNWGTPNGPIFGHFAAGVTNKDLFSGRPLVNDTMSTKEKTQIYTKYIASQWLPSSPGFAGSYHTNNILDGLKSQFEDTVLSNALEDLGYTGTNYRGEEVELKRALLGAGGIKIRGQSVSEQKQKALVKLNNERKALKSEITKTRKNGTMTDARKQAKIEDLQERFKILSEKMKEFHDAEDE